MTTTTSLGTTNATNRRTLTPADTGDWRDSAECRTQDPDLFFPIGTTGQYLVQAEQAKTVCNRCGVRSACLEWALSTDQRTGIWGGLTEEERRPLAGDRTGQRVSVELCIEAQAYIEKRITEKATYRVIASELGVTHHAVARAVRFFETERAAQAGLEVAA